MEEGVNQLITSGLPDLDRRSLVTSVLWTGVRWPSSVKNMRKKSGLSRSAGSAWNSPAVPMCADTAEIFCFRILSEGSVATGCLENRGGGQGTHTAPGGRGKGDPAGSGGPAESGTGETGQQD